MPRFAFLMRIALLSGLFPIAHARVDAAAHITYARQLRGEDWDAPSIWEPNDGLSPHPNDVYVARHLPGQPETIIRNPVNGTDITFRGDSLTVNAATALLLNAKAPGQDTTITFEADGLIMNGGRIIADDDVVFTLAGRFTPIPVAGNYLEAWHPVEHVAYGAFKMAASIVSQATIRHFSAPSRGPTLEVTSSNPQFEGGWHIFSGWLKGTGIDSLGSGDITLDEHFDDSGNLMPSVLDIDYDLSSLSRLSVRTHSVVRLDQHLTFGSVWVGGVALEESRYTAAELIQRFPANFAPIGEGSTAAGALTVLPEPSSIAFTLTTAVGCFTLRRRR